MKHALLFNLLLSCTIPALTFAQTQPKRTLLLELKDVTQEQAGKGLFSYDSYRKDIVISNIRNNVLMLATHAEAAVLKERGYDFTIVMEDTVQLNLYKRAIYGATMTISSDYHTYEQIMQKVDALVRQHPKVIKKIAIGQTTQEKRTIFAVKISSDVGKIQDKPGILFNGCHHSDELIGAEIATALMQELVAQYNKDSTITDWVNGYEIYIVPVVNVDGHYVVTHNIDPRWRKNARDLNNNSILYEYPEGVDLNRNYDFNWAKGGSNDSLNLRYRGQYPFSESENRAMRNLLQKKKFLLSITYHSQGEVIYYPWVWGDRKAPDDKLLTEIANGLAGSIVTMDGDTTYKAEYGAGMVGQSYPWFYGRHGTFDFVVETGKGAHIFPPEEVEGIVKSNLNGAHYLLDCGKGPGLTGHVTDARTGKPLEAIVWLPSIETEDIDRRTTDHRFGRYWRLLLPGSYDLVVMKEGYQIAIFKDVKVAEEGWTILDVELEPERH